jgi:hypothetical protein
MQISPLPTPFPLQRGRRFSFYPPIRDIPHNEWIYRRATWSEFVAVNARSGEEACIPRMFLAEVSPIDEPIVIVGLKRELEWKEGAVACHRRPVIELPVAVNDTRAAAPAPTGHLAPVVNIRLEPRPVRKIGVAAMLGAVACLLAVDFAVQIHQRPGAPHRVAIPATAGDDYFSIVNKLGPPASDHTVDAPGGNLVYRTLAWRTRSFSIVLMGPTRHDARYIGALDRRGHPIDFVTLPDGSNTAALLRSLPAF